MARQQAAHASIPACQHASVAAPTLSLHQCSTMSGCLMWCVQYLVTAAGRGVERHRGWRKACGCTALLASQLLACTTCHRNAYTCLGDALACEAMFIVSTLAPAMHCHPLN